MKKKKQYLILLGTFLILLAIIGVTYAYWTISLSQNEKNIISSSCFEVSLENENDPILLKKARPITDEEAKELVPYTFTIHNKCDAAASYQINLEILEGTTLDEQYLKYILNEELKEKKGSYFEKEVEPTLVKDSDQKKADKAYELKKGYLKPNEKKNYELRLYLDGKLTIENQEVMNKSFSGKITVIATYAKEIPKTLEETILAIETKAEDSGESGLYEVEHTNAEITYTDDSIIKANLQKTELRYAGSNPNNYVDFGEKYEEDKYELIFCLQKACANIKTINGIPALGTYTTQESCEEQKKEVERMLSQEPETKDGSVKCEQIAKSGEPLYWRIIGLVNTPEGQRAKIVRNESIGEFSWDTSEENLNDGLGVNEWSQSDLMKLLNPGYETNQGQICRNNEYEYSITCNEPDDLVNNSLYWNGGEGQCYTGAGNSASVCNFTNNKIPNSLKNIIEDVTWTTGSNPDLGEGPELLDSNDFYEYERSNNAGDGCKLESDDKISCNDETNRTTSWKGKVGLIYPSDYGYATSGGTVGRTTCLSDIQLGSNPKERNCYANNWLYSGNEYWTLSPVTLSENASYIFNFHSSGHMGYQFAARVDTEVRPSVYLKLDVYVKQGNGSKNNPYILES